VVVAVEGAQFVTTDRFTIFMLISFARGPMRVLIIFTADTATLTRALLLCLVAFAVAFAAVGFLTTA